MKRTLTIAATILLSAAAYAQKQYTVTSPDGGLSATVSAGDSLTYSISFRGKTVLDSSPVSMTLDDGTVWGHGSRLSWTRRSSSDATVSSPFYRSSEVRDRYNSITMTFRGDWNIEFRAYNDGIAYRFAYTGKRQFNVKDEEVRYNLPEDSEVTLPYVNRTGGLEAQLFSSFENRYTVSGIQSLDRERLAFLPIVAESGDGVRMCITEVNLESYPGLYLRRSGDGGSSLEGYFARYPKTEVQGGHNNLQMIVSEREEYIARVDGARKFPWRAVVVSGSDCGLASSDLGYLLAEPSRLEDISWIRPGKVAWEWWNDWNLDGVDFITGVNSETYMAYIDFASAQGIEYVILDEGWAVRGAADLMQVVPEIDLQKLVDYASARNVGIILWAGYRAFEKDMENVCRHYSEMGVKGFKVDFMDRDDQKMTAFNYRAAETAARYRLVLDLHGTHKPAGLNRTWPNVLNFEGVFGLEQLKWGQHTDQVEYDAMIPFIRQVSGPMDYTQGAMRNASRENYRPCNSEPMSQGTRCHQLALYMVLDSPLNMMCDSPSNYMREQECTGFIAGIPTFWDETRILDGQIGEYIVTARRKGSTWYIGGITDWTPRDLSIDLSFIGEGEFTAELFTDGKNAHRTARDYRREVKAMDVSEAPLEVHLAPGGGFAARISVQ